MSKMADPMIALLKFQNALDSGPPIDPHILVDDYLTMYDEPNGGKRFTFAKIVDGEVQALSIFGLEDPIDGVTCYNVGYAVSETHRRRGLAFEAVNKGIKELKKVFGSAGVKTFYLEAVINTSNIPSIRLAERLFSSTGTSIIERESGVLALHFKKLITT